MKEDTVPDQDHISRYCSATKCTETGEVTGAAFMLRVDEDFLSVNWMEFLNLADQQAEIEEVRRVLGSKLILGLQARIAVLNVGETVRYVKENSLDNKQLKVLHEPEEDDPSHSGIHGYGHENSLIADLIAEKVRQTYPARI